MLRACLGQEARTGATLLAVAALAAIAILGSFISQRITAGRSNETGSPASKIQDRLHASLTLAAVTRWRLARVGESLSKSKGGITRVLALLTYSRATVSLTPSSASLRHRIVDARLERRSSPCQNESQAWRRQGLRLKLLSGMIPTNCEENNRQADVSRHRLRL